MRNPEFDRTRAAALTLASAGHLSYDIFSAISYFKHQGFKVQTILRQHPSSAETETPAISQKPMEHHVLSTTSTPTRSRNPVRGAYSLANDLAVFYLSFWWKGRSGSVQNDSCHHKFSVVVQCKRDFFYSMWHRTDTYNIYLYGYTRAHSISINIFERLDRFNLEIYKIS
jgi:hypothetical protein